MNFIAKRYLAEPGIFSSGTLEQFLMVHISAGDYLWYLLRVRVVPFGVLAALAFTKMRKLSVALFLLWTGLSGGILISSAILSMGIRGKHFLSDRINATVSDVCSCMLCSDLVQLVLSAESLEQTEDGVCPADAFHGYDSGDLCESDHRLLVYRHDVIRMIRKAK